MNSKAGTKVLTHKKQGLGHHPAPAEVYTRLIIVTTGVPPVYLEAGTATNAFMAGWAAEYTGK